MARKVFFSFHFSKDVWKVSQIRNSWRIWWEKTPFLDKAEWEKVKLGWKLAIQRWIDKQLMWTSVTVVLIGLETSNREWVKYEIAKSVEMWKGIVGIHIAWMVDQNGNSHNSLWKNPLPAWYKTYKWNKDNWVKNMWLWIEEAARNAWK